MEYYYKEINENGETIGVVSYSPNKPNITDPMIIEIDQAEFEAYLAEIAEPDEPSDEPTIAEKAMAYDILVGNAE